MKQNQWFSLFPQVKFGGHHRPPCLSRSPFRRWSSPCAYYGWLKSSGTCICSGPATPPTPPLSRKASSVGRSSGRRSTCYLRWVKLYPCIRYLNLRSVLAMCEIYAKHSGEAKHAPPSNFRGIFGAPPPSHTC